MSFQSKRIFFRGRVFVVPPMVYEPADDTFLLAKHLVLRRGEKVLDMGTGCGLLAVIAAEKASQVVAVDINPQAITCAEENAKTNGVGEQVETRLGDLFEAIKASERFDSILFNPPYLPVEESKEKTWIEKAWSGGSTGRLIIDRFIDDAPAYLSKGGCILLVQSSLSSVAKTLEKLTQHNLQVSIVNELRLFFEKIVLVEAVRN